MIYAAIRITQIKTEGNTPIPPLIASKKFYENGHRCLFHKNLFGIIYATCGITQIKTGGNTPIPA
jgi:hypothetical protein